MKPLYSRSLTFSAAALVCLLWTGPIWSQPADPAPPPVPAMEPATPEVPKPPAVAETTEPLDSEPSGREIHDAVRVGTDFELKEGEEASEVVVVFGTATIKGKVRGDVVVVLGKAKITGKIGGTLVAPMTSVELGPTAEIGGELVAVGGSIEADPAAKIDGQRIEITWDSMESKFPPLKGIKSYFLHGILLLRPLPHQWGWWWILALVLGAFYVLASLIFPKAINATATTLEAQPVGSFFIGVLLVLLFAPLNLLLMATGIGLIVVPFFLCAVAAGFVFGKVAVYRYTGMQVARQSGVTALEAPLLALLLGMVLFCLMFMVPLLGFIVWGVIGPLGLGAATLAMFRALRSEGGRSGGTTANPNPGTPAFTNPPVILADGSAAFTPGESVSLPRVGFWLRFLATFLDLILVGAASSVLTHVFPPVFLLFWLAYHVGMWAWKGTTIGGIVVGIKIIRNDGRPLDFPVALVRSLAGFLSAAVLFLGFFWAGWSRDKLGWHDQIAGTIVVKVPRGLSLI